MKEVLKGYKMDLQREMKDFAKQPITPDSLHLMKEVEKVYLLTTEVEGKVQDYPDCGCETKRLTEADIKSWNDRMETADCNGTIIERGSHWDVEATDSVAQVAEVNFTHITRLEWNVTMNMMYSDYVWVAKCYGLDQPTFYAKLAKAFLFDVDGKAPYLKLYEYYHNVVM